MKDHGHTYKFYLNHYFLDRASEYGGGSKFSGYAETSTEPLGVKFCNFVQLCID
jgi:hypothetical protein